MEAVGVVGMRVRGGYVRVEAVGMRMEAFAMGERCEGEMGLLGWRDGSIGEWVISCFCCCFRYRVTRQFKFSANPDNVSIATKEGSVLATEIEGHKESTVL